MRQQCGKDVGGGGGRRDARMEEGGWMMGVGQGRGRMEWGEGGVDEE